MNWQQRIKNALEKKRVRNELRSRIIIEKKVGRFLIYNGCQYHDFSSNDYLGLSHHPEIILAWQKGAELYGVGSSSSGHISGYMNIHHQLEEELAEWLGYPRALLFISGFAANHAVISALVTKKDQVISDRLCHASLIEAAYLSMAQLKRFRHNNMQNLELLLKNNCTGQRLLVTEGIFSMDGDSAPLTDLYSVAKRTNSWLMVDDAHGFGVTGKNGRGSCSKQYIKPDLLVVTFGKGAGVSGAAVLCNEDIADYLLQYARHLIYSTIMPPAQSMALIASLRVIRSEEGEEKRQKLNRNILYFCNGVNLLGLNSLKSKSAIQPLLVGENIRAELLAQNLRSKKIWTIAIRPPTVPAGTARLRLTLSALHKKNDLNLLLEALDGSSR